MSRDVLTVTSPLLELPGAVPTESGPDAGTARHYGDPFAEQRVVRDGVGLVDRTTRGVLVVPGQDRLGWLHSICSQHLTALTDGDSTEALVLSPHGHVEQHWQLTELGGRVWIDVEPGTAAAAADYLETMRFLKRVEPADVTAEWAVLGLLGPGTSDALSRAGLPVPEAAGRAVARPAGGFVRRTDAGADVIVARSDVAGVTRQLLAAGCRPVGAWAVDAWRVEHRQPRLGQETDHRTIPHEVGWIGTAVHLDKGCYRGQETVARVQNLGRAPRQLRLLHLAGENDELPAPGTPVMLAGRAVGFVGTAVHHHEYGPVALGVVKRTVAGEGLTVDGDPVAVDAD